MRAMTTDTLSIEGIEFLELVRDNGSISLWKARQTALDRLVTVRVLHGPAAADPALRAEFAGISRILAKLHCDGVIEVYDISDSASNPYMVAEWADGPTVAEAVANAHGPLSLRTSLAAATQIASALDTAWNERRLLFRNLKPTEIRIGKEQAKIVNFGLAVSVPQGSDSYNVNGEIVGTPHFSAPEQLRGLPVDFHSEMFSLGATLYLMLTGHPPYEQMTPEQILANDKPGCIVNPRDLNPKVTPATANLVARLMMRDPKDRYESWKDFRADVASILAGKPSPRLAAAPTGESMVAVPAKTPASPEAPATSAAGKFGNAAKDVHRQGASFFHGLLWLLLAAWIVVLGNDRLGNPLNLPFKLPSMATPSNSGEIGDEDGDAGFEPAAERDAGDFTPDDAAPAAPAVLEAAHPAPVPAQPAKPSPAKAELPASAVGALASALLEGGVQAAVAALPGLGLDKSAESEIRDALSAIPDADEMVMDTLLERKDEVVTIVYQGKERDIKPLRGVNGVLHTDFIVSGQPPRPVSFPISKLGADERLRWMPTPDGEGEHSAYCLLALQAGKRDVALSHAGECGPLAPVFKAASETIGAANTEE